MDPRRVRTAVTAGALAVTAAIAAAVAADPIPGQPAHGTAAVPAQPSGAEAAVRDLEARAARRLARAEERLAAVSGSVPAATAPAPAPPPVVAVAPAPAAPVTSSGSS